jgi:hypothetical protein
MMIPFLREFSVRKQPYRHRGQVSYLLLTIEGIRSGIDSKAKQGIRVEGRIIRMLHGADRPGQDLDQNIRTEETA